MQPPQQISIGNRLLASLSSEDFATLRPHLEPVPLAVRQVLIEPNTAIAHVYFPEAGMASVTNNSSGGKIEVGVVGREGMVGLPIVLGIDQTPYEHFMQIAGHGREQLPAPAAAALCLGVPCSGLRDGVCQRQQ
jgi:CRP-like cAMP-binding protein